MPNYCYNSMTIEASPEQLVQDWWLVKTEEETNWHKYDQYQFNLHKLFPKQFPEEFEKWSYDYVNSQQSMKAPDTFAKYWDYDWCVNNLWSKWIPHFTHEENISVEWHFFSCYDTARSPVLQLLEEFHKQSWINLECEYEEPWNCFEWTFTCEDWECMDDEREYITPCEVCEEKEESTAWCVETDSLICQSCLDKYNLKHNTNYKHEE